MTSGGPRRRCVASALAVATLVLAAGCRSGSEPAGGDPATGSSTSSAPVPVPAPTSSAPMFEVDEKLVIKVPGASMHPLATYKHLVDYGIVQGWNDGQSAVTFAPDVNLAKSLDGFAKRWISQNGGPKVQVRQDNAVAGGKYNAWHVVDTTSDPVQVTHTFGILFLESAWLIEITIYLDGDPEPLTEDEQQGVIDSLLGTFKTDLD